MASNIELYPEQLEALEKLFPGAVLLADTGSGKTYTSLFYYAKNFADRELYVITTARKRDDGDWVDEAADVGINKITVDSWNNIQKYKNVRGAFFIFDEQRVVGYGAWAKSFIAISKYNKWIMLSATPGDVWLDYVPLFIANGFYRNKTDFTNQHVEWNPYVNFPQVKRYHNEAKLKELRDHLMVIMKTHKKTIKDKIYLKADFNFDEYHNILQNRWNIYTGEPIKNGSELLMTLRRQLYSSDDRKRIAKFIMSVHDRLIIFYNFDFELEILKNLCTELGAQYYQWNGHIHEVIPDSGDWIYLVQYLAGSEAWNCISTDTILFYSLNYSYRTTKQAEGRIDRINTPFKRLNYYYIYSPKSIDDSILKAIRIKKSFNANTWLKKEKIC